VRLTSDDSQVLHDAFGGEVRDRSRRRNNSRRYQMAEADSCHKHLGRGDCLLLAGSGLAAGICGNRLAFLSVLR
jgi:hypothetical protein